ncbi:MAG: tetratricopeptide repeat protein [Candidatus Brocadiae bacterium]|nr:tetratricopeptide repeat protein [Candidatus Brocadiia bacterium]
MYTKGYRIENRYVLTSSLGRGSFGEVWSAYDEINKKEIAIKICKAALIADDEEEREKAIRRFRDEISLMKRARSSYMVEILDYGKEKESVPPHAWYYYIIMEKMEGTLADSLQKFRNEGKEGIRLEDFFRYAECCLLGLADLHKKGIIHRDIKPSNLFFSKQNAIKIGDLGIARLSERTRQTQTMFGTVGYAAPELFVHKEQANEKSDLFSLGIAFYEMLTLRHPCSDKGAFYLSKETIRRMVSADFYPIQEIRKNLPEHLIQLIQAMIAARPDERPSSAEQVLQQIQKIRQQIATFHFQNAQEAMRKNQQNQAVESLLQSAAIISENPEVYNQIALIYYNQRLYEKAIEYFSKTLYLKKDKAPYTNRGLCYYYLQKYDEAIADFSKAIQIDPRFADAYNNRGLAYHKKKDYYRALQNFHRTLTIKTNDARAYNNRGMTYSEQEEYDKAIMDFTRSIKIQPHDPESYFNRGLAYRHKKLFDQAIADFSKAIQYDSKDVYSYYQRALLYQKIGDYPKALADFKEAQRLRPDNTKLQKGIQICEEKIRSR